MKMTGRGRGRGRTQMTKASSKPGISSQGYSVWLQNVKNVYEKKCVEEQKETLMELLSVSKQQTSEWLQNFIVEDANITTNSAEAGVEHVADSDSEVAQQKKALIVEEALLAVENPGMLAEILGGMDIRNTLFGDLPPELLQKILIHLSDKEAARCRQVCKRWRFAVDHVSGIWEKRCERIGILKYCPIKHHTEPAVTEQLLVGGDNDEKDEWAEEQVDPAYWYRLYADFACQVRSLRRANKGALHRVTFSGEDKITSDVINYQHGCLFLSKGTDKKLKDGTTGMMMSISSGKQRLFAADYHCATIKLYTNRSLMTFSARPPGGMICFHHFESIASSKEKSIADKREVVTIWRHVPRCVDCQSELDLLVIGFNDGNLEFWSVSKSKRWHVIVKAHKLEIFRVVVALLGPFASKNSGDYRIISYDYERIFVWNIDSESTEGLFHLDANMPPVDGNEPNWGHYAYGMMYKYGIIFYLHTKDPACQLKMAELGTGKVVMSITLHSNEGACKFSSTNPSILNTEQLSCRVMALLDVGKRFGLLLIKQSGYHIVLLDLKYLEAIRLVGLRTCLLHRQQQGVFPSMVVPGDSKWLDGFNHTSVKGALFAYADHENPLVCEERGFECDRVHVIKWSHSVRQDPSRLSQKIIHQPKIRLDLEEKES